MHRKAAVALAYEPTRDAAPRVTAVGWGATAERMLALAEEAGVPIHEDGTLIELLACVQPGRTIPPEAWALVAELFAFLAEVDARMAEKLAGNRRDVPVGRGAEPALSAREDGMRDA